jgi:hypothetical protein
VSSLQPGLESGLDDPMTTLAVSVLAASLAVAAADDRAAQIVGAPAAPVRLDSAKVLNTGSQPLVLLYAATNTDDKPVEQFTVMVFVYSADGQLKARQVAPGRRELKGRETKYSAMVLDVGTIEASDTLMAGVDQVQHVDSDEWWRTDLRAIAEAAADAKRGASRPPRR